MYKSLYKVGDKVEQLGYYAQQHDRARAFRSWKRKIHFVFEHHHHTRSILDTKCTILVPNTIPWYALRAASLFIQSKLSHKITIPLESCDMNDPIAILLRLEDYCSGTNPAMQRQIVSKLHSQKINTGETGSSFIARMHFVFDEAYSYNIDVTEREKIDLILEGLRPNHTYKGYIIHYTLKRAEENRSPHLHRLDDLSITDIERDINAFDRLSSRTTTTSYQSNRTNTNHTNSNTYRSSRPQNNHNQNTKYRGVSHHTANQVDTNRKPVKCFHCGGAHKIGDCKTVTPEQKEVLWNQYRASQTQKQPTHQKPRHIQQSAAAISDIEHPSRTSSTKKSVHFSSTRRPSPHLEANLVEIKLELEATPPTTPPVHFTMVPIKEETPPSSPQSMTLLTSPTSTQYSPYPPDYSPTSPAYSDTSIQYFSRSPSPDYSRTSPMYSPLQLQPVLPPRTQFINLPPPPLYINPTAKVLSHLLSATILPMPSSLSHFTMYILSPP